MQTKTIKLVAGVWYQAQIPESGFFTLAETEQALDVHLFQSEGFSGELSVGVESGFRVMVRDGGRPIGFVKLFSSVNQTVKIGYSFHGREVDNKKVTSTVAVIDGSDERSKKGEAFSAHIYSAAAASLYSQCQLWNPVGSGKIAVVTEFVGYHNYSSSAVLQWGIHNAALPSLDATYGGGNKDFSNSSAGGIEARKDQGGSVLPVAGGVLRRTVKKAYETDDFDLEEPIILRPGNGLLCSSDKVSTYLVCTMQYYEVSE